MTADRINRLILISLLGISLFMLLDCYMLPLDTSKAVVVTKSEQTLSKLRVAIYRIQTQRTSITIPAMAYNKIREMIRLKWAVLILHIPSRKLLFIKKEPRTPGVQVLFL